MWVSKFEVTRVSEVSTCYCWQRLFDQPLRRCPIPFNLGLGQEAAGVTGGAGVSGVPGSLRGLRLQHGPMGRLSGGLSPGSMAAGLIRCAITVGAAGGKRAAGEARGHRDAILAGAQGLRPELLPGPSSRWSGAVCRSTRPLPSLASWLKTKGRSTSERYGSR